MRCNTSFKVSRLWQWQICQYLVSLALPLYSSFTKLFFFFFTTCDGGQFPRRRSFLPFSLLISKGPKRHKLNSEGSRRGVILVADCREFNYARYVPAVSGSTSSGLALLLSPHKSPAAVLVHHASTHNLLITSASTKRRLTGWLPFLDDSTLIKSQHLWHLRRQHWPWLVIPFYCILRDRTGQEGSTHNHQHSTRVKERGGGLRLSAASLYWIASYILRLGHKLDGFDQSRFCVFYPFTNVAGVARGGLCPVNPTAALWIILFSA